MPSEKDQHCLAEATGRQIDRRQSPIEKTSGFTLIELLLAMAVLALMAVMMLSVTSSAQKIAKQTTSRTEQFREGRRAFERINQRLSQATLNTYWDYVDKDGKPRVAGNATFTPNKYFRISELRYLQTNASSLTAPGGGTMVGNSVFFQAPLGKSDTTSLAGLNSLLNTVGFFIEKGSDSTLRPPTVAASKTRYRLFELTEPAESLTIYSLTSGNSTTASSAWFTTPLAAPGNSHRLADNIVALLFQAQYSIPNNTNGTSTPTSSFLYSSAPISAGTSGNQTITENNLPPNVRVIMIALDEPSARRVAEGSITLTDATDETSLESLEKNLTDNRLNYRKFESTVSIGPAKWSSR